MVTITEASHNNKLSIKSGPIGKIKHSRRFSYLLRGEADIRKPWQCWHCIVLTKIDCFNLPWSTIYIISHNSQMTKRRLLYSSPMALILPQIKDIAKGYYLVFFDPPSNLDLKKYFQFQKTCFARLKLLSLCFLSLDLVTKFCFVNETKFD